jgi:quinol monooxygenase YgiN
MIIRIVRLTLQADKIDAFLQNFEENKQKIRHFEGCTHLEVWRDVHNPAIFCTYSHWISEEYLEKYRNSDLFKNVWAFTKKLFADKPIAFSVAKFTEVS